MDKVKLGRTGLEVSVFGFGGIPIASVSPEEAVKLLHRGLELDLNFWDTAAMYGTSEEKMGLALKGIRDKIILATKNHSRNIEDGRQLLENSFEKLQTDYIDLYQVHNLATPEHLEYVTAPGGLLDYLEEQKERGRIRHIGLTSHSAEMAAKALDTGRFETLQFPFNFIELQAEEQGLFDKARRMGLGLIAMKPLGGGLLDEARLCFGFLRRYPDVVPIPGFKEAAEIEEVAGLYESGYSLSPADEARLEEIRSELGTRFCRRCGYCQPCPENIQIPFALMVPSSLKRNGPGRTREVFGKHIELARGCAECGECIEKCPYNLPVPEMLAAVIEMYDNNV